MSEGSPVNLTTGLPETMLPPVDPQLATKLEQAVAGENSRTAIGEVIAADPTYLDAWAKLSDVARDDIERYAYARIGYHRGLDALRKSGWRGSGYVRWSNETNRGFLRCLARLANAANKIGESVEAERCELFLRQLDPDWSKVNLD